jgi:ABC-type uncharacterized transport system permease subunit
MIDACADVGGDIAQRAPGEQCRAGHRQRPEPVHVSSSVGEVIAGIALLLLSGYAFSWVFAFIGLSSSSPEALNAYGFTILFPVTFVSSAFVPVDSMPSWLQPIAEHNPFTYMVNAAPALFLGVPAGNNVWLALVWTLGFIAVFAPLSAWRYRRVVTR